MRHKCISTALLEYFGKGVCPQKYKLTVQSLQLKMFITAKVYGIHWANNLCEKIWCYWEGNSLNDHVWLNVMSKNAHGDEITRGILLLTNAEVSLFTEKSLQLCCRKELLMSADCGL